MLQRKEKNIFKRKMNTRGDATDIILFIVLILFLGISFIVGIFFNDIIKDVISTTQLNETSPASGMVSQLETFTTSTVQNAFVVIFGFLVIGVMISAFLVRVHPAFIFIWIIFLAVALFTSVFLANTYQAFIETEALSSIASQQTAMNWILQHLVLITLAVGALSMVITFSRAFGGSMGGVSDV